MVLAIGGHLGMPLQFFISGMGSCCARRFRSATAFARQRLRQLGIPLVTGIFATSKPGVSLPTTG